MTERLTNETVIDSTAWEDISQQQSVEDDELALLNEALDTSDQNVRWKIKVGRVIKDTGEIEHCFYARPSELSNLLERIKNEYGAGHYEVTVYRNGKYFKKPRFNIAAQVDKPGAGPGGERQGVGSLADLAAVLAEQNRQNLDQLRDLLQNRPAVDPMTQMTSMIGMMVQMKEFLQPPAGGGGGDAITQFKNMLEVQDMLAERAGDSGGSILENLTQAFVTAAPALQAAGQPSGRRRLVAPGPGAVAEHQGQPKPKKRQQKLAPEVVEMINGLKLFCSAAKRNLSVDPYAFMVIDKFEPEQIAAFILAPDAFEKLTKIYPPVAQYREWFNDLTFAIQQELQAMHDEQIQQQGGLTPDDSVSIHSHDAADNSDTSQDTSG